MSPEVVKTEFTGKKIQKLKNTDQDL